MPSDGPGVHRRGVQVVLPSPALILLLSSMWSAWCILRSKQEGDLCEACVTFVTACVTDCVTRALGFATCRWGNSPYDEAVKQGNPKTLAIMEIYK